MSSIEKFFVAILMVMLVSVVATGMYLGVI